MTSEVAGWPKEEKTCPLIAGHVSALLSSWWATGQGKILIFYKLLVCEETVSIPKWLRSFAELGSISCPVSNYSPFCRSSPLSVHHSVVLFLCQECCGRLALAPALHGVASFSVCQPPNLTSNFQRERNGLAVSKLVLFFDSCLCCRMQPSPGYAQRDVNSLNWETIIESRVNNCKKTCAYSAAMRLCMQSSFFVFPWYEMLLRDLSEQVRRKKLIFLCLS